METNWTLYGISAKDWVLKDWVKILKPKYSYQELKKAFWQFPVSKNSCSIHGAITMVANTFNVDYSLEERKAIWEVAKTKWASDEWGWRFHEAIQLVKSWSSEHKGLEFNYFSIPKTQFKEYAEKGFAVYWGIKVKENSTRDKLKDGYVWDDVENFWEMKFWHAVCFTMIDWEFWFVDNYPEKTKYNEVKFRNLDQLLENGYFYNTGYICCTTDEVVKNGYNWLTLEEKKAKLAARPEAQANLKKN